MVLTEFIGISSDIYNKKLGRYIIQIIASGTRNLENPILNLPGSRYKNRHRQVVLVVDQLRNCPHWRIPGIGRCNSFDQIPFVQSG